MYVCPYATVNKVGFACKYRDEAMETNRDLGLIDDLRGTNSYIKPRRNNRNDYGGPAYGMGRTRI